jgi:hypothetical protein
MEYEGSIGFVMKIMKTRTFYGRLSRKFEAVAVRKICTASTGSALSARKLKFWLPESFEPT